MDAIPDSTTIPLRKCSKCGCEFPATTDHFHRSKSGLYGLHKICKLCCKAIAHARYMENPSRSHENARRWRANNPEKHNEIARKFRERNPDKVKAAQRRWEDAHPDRRKEIDRLWQSKNHAKTRVKARNRRTLKASLPATFTSDHEQIALEYFHGRCAVCGRPLRDLFGQHKLSFDHWIPLAKGGGTIPKNMVPLCHGFEGCNNRKRDTDPEKWLVEAFGKRRAKEVLERINAYFEWVKE